MNKNIEIEKRVILNHEQYKKLKEYALSFSTRQEMTLINYYFDTKDLELRNAHHMLRIRNINDDEYEMTLKVKGEEGDLEINEPLSKDEVKGLLNNFEIINTTIAEYVNKVTSNKVNYLTSLKTERIEIIFDNYLFVLDKNYYSDVIDYDLEIEASDIDTAKEVIKKYCSEYGMQYDKNYKSKSRRAINKALNI